MKREVQERYIREKNSAVKFDTCTSLKDELQRGSRLFSSPQYTLATVTYSSPLITLLPTMYLVRDISLFRLAVVTELIPPRRRQSSPSDPFRQISPLLSIIQVPLLTLKVFVVLWFLDTCFEHHPVHI